MTRLLIELLELAHFRVSGKICNPIRTNSRHVALVKTAAVHQEAALLSDTLAAHVRRAGAKGSALPRRPAAHPEVRIVDKAPTGPIGLHWKSEYWLPGSPPCAFPRSLRRRNRPHHQRLEFRSCRRLRKALCLPHRIRLHHPFRRHHRIRRHCGISLRRETIQERDRPALRHHLPMTRRWNSPAPPRTADHYRRPTAPGRSASLHAIRPNLQWLWKSGMWIEAGSSLGVSRPQIFRRSSKTPAGRRFRCRPGSRYALLDLNINPRYYILNTFSTRNFLYPNGAAERAPP
jgi:hypothetical protein